VGGIRTGEAVIALQGAGAAGCMQMQVYGYINGGRQNRYIKVHSFILSTP
jgi:hypothetical protein